jgi:putative transposase
MKYPTDLTDKQWELIEPIFKAYLGKYGNRAKWGKRVLVNAVLYVTKTGCQWRMLPNDFPPCWTVYDFFRRMKIKGIWEQVNALLVRKTREKAGKSPHPSYGLIDSQSAKTTGASEERGIDGGKKS